MWNRLFQPIVKEKEKENLILVGFFCRPDILWLDALVIVPCCS